MSREARDWVWDRAPIEDPRQLLILLSMADVADEDGGSAYPSVARLARDSRSSQRTVQRHLSALVETGVIEIERPAIGRRPTTYRFPDVASEGRQSVTPNASEGRQRGDRGVTNDDDGPLLYGTGTGSRDVVATRGDARSAELVVVDPLDGFDAFWNTYPKRNGRRLGRGKCELRWRKLSADERSAATLGALHYAADVDRGLTIAKDPDRWLRDRCWTDWQEPPSTGGDRPGGPRGPRGGDPLRGRHTTSLADELAKAMGE